MNNKATTPSGMQRVFIGIPVDKQSQRHINDLLESIGKSEPNIRWVPESNRHLTFAFLGNIPVSDVENLLRLFGETYQQETHFEFKLTKLTRFPKSRGRIIALTGDPDERLSSLFGITRKLLQELKIEFDRKEFRPHITLGRIRNEKRFKTTFDKAININLGIDKITLYKSTLTETGSIYSILKETQLD